MASAGSADVDSYLATLPDDVRALLEDLRQVIKKTVPDAEEAMSYKIPTFSWHGFLVGFAAFKHHCGFYIGSAEVLAAHQEQLQDYGTEGTKTTIRFTVDKPLPKSVVRSIVKARMAENKLRKKRK